MVYFLKCSHEFITFFKFFIKRFKYIVKKKYIYIYNQLPFPQAATPHYETAKKNYITLLLYYSTNENKVIYVT